MVPLGDGDAKDAPDKLCVEVVELATGRRQSGAEWGEEQARRAAKHSTLNCPHGTADFSPRLESQPSTFLLPRCLDLITAEEAIRRIQLYFDGGAVRFLSEKERAACESAIASQERKSECMAR